MSIPPETRYARNGAIHLAYQVLGSGPPDLLVVQSGANTHVDYVWMEPSLARFMRRLASFSRLVTYDNRGVGLSDPVAGGDEPPFHTPVFVLTHHTRPSFTLGDTTFHFVDAGPELVLDRARDAAQGKDVRLGGGATTIRQFLGAGLVDTMHMAVSQVELGSGSRLWESPDELLDEFHLEVVPSPNGVTHHLFWRR